MIYVKMYPEDFDEIKKEFDVEKLECDSLADEMKLESYMENQNKFTLIQFEEFLKSIAK